MAFVPNAPQSEADARASFAPAAAPPFSPKRPAGLPSGESAPAGRIHPAARRAQRQYQQAQVETASPTQLILLLYDGTIRFCSLGLEALQARNYEEKHNYLIKAQRIVSELMVSLNREAGGEVAQNLFNLYVFTHEQLVRANMEDDDALLKNAIQTLSDLRESWAEVDRLQSRGQASGSPSASG